MNNENTIFDEEITPNGISSTSKSAASTSNEKVNPVRVKKAPLWRKVAVGMGAGILLGTTSSFMTSAIAGETSSETDNASDSDSSSDAGNVSAVTDGEVAVASSVSDDMSFSEAFAAAREELGPGGAFEWHGNVYATYTAEEWDDMTSDEKDEYGSHFNWSSDDSTGVVADASTEAEESNNDAVAGVSSENDTDADSEESIEVVAVDESDNNFVIEGDVQAHESEDGVELEQEAEVIDANPEVEVLGVVHDSESGADIAGVSVNGQEVILVDLDGSGEADVIAVDINGDGQLTEDEVSDISSEHIQMSQFENPYDDNLYAEGPDYINDAPDGSALV